MRVLGLTFFFLMASSSLAFGDVPSSETKLHLAESEVTAGKWLRAEEHLRDVIASQREDDQTRATAKQELAALTPRIPRLRVVVLSPDDEPRKVLLEIDGNRSLLILTTDLRGSLLNTGSKDYFG